MAPAGAAPSAVRQETGGGHVRNTFWTILLIIHGLLAVALLGALTHQAMAVLMPVRQAAGNFVDRFRAVPAAGYATAVCVLWVVTFIMGAWIYTKYRITSASRSSRPATGRRKASSN